jgi:CheY-like chemotaxis protein
MPRPRILSLGYDDVLMPTRSLLLHSAGYEVADTNSWGEALRRLKSEPFDLLLICHTVPGELRDALMDAVHLVKPHQRFLCLTAAPVYSAPDRCPPACNTAPEFLVDVSNVLDPYGKTGIVHS